MSQLIYKSSKGNIFLIRKKLTKVFNHGVYLVVKFGHQIYMAPCNPNSIKGWILILCGCKFPCFPVWVRNYVEFPHHWMIKQVKYVQL